MAEGAAKPGGITFEVFVKNAILKVQKEAGGRGKEVTEIRQECQKYLETLEKGGFGEPFDEMATKAALKPLRLACACGIPRVVEPALGCIHKLVSLAWIKAESAAVGPLDDGNIVGELIKMVIKCLDIAHAGVYLAVLTALLTFATAEHFIAHGQCLLHMVKSVFHLAVSCDDMDLRRTACNALLQMLNTIVKRVTVMQFQMTLQNSRSIEPMKSSEVVDFDGAEASPSVARTSSVSPKFADESRDNTEDPGPGGEMLKGRPHEDGKISLPSSHLTAKLTSLAEKQDIEGLEAALEMSGRVRNMKTEVSEGSIQEVNDGNEADAEEHINNSSSPRSESKEGKRPPGWNDLTVLEKDVIIVIAAFCKLAGTTHSEGSSDDVYQQGKLLALELLVKVFENSGHKWGNVRLQFCEQLRLPLCLVLVRNCSPGEPKFSVRLFCAIMLQDHLRQGLKAELGALYPLLLLRPMETRPLDPGLLFVALSSVKRLSREPQMQVDLFINYDCDLQAANLYERTSKVLSELAVLGDPTAPAGQGTRVRDAAVACCISMMSSLDAWTGPIRDAAAIQELSSPSTSYTSPFSKGSSEVSHFSASKEKKNSLYMGLELFNRNPLKGIASLVASGVVENKAESLAAFLRKNRNKLDETTMGEYMGHHDDMPISVMHAYIDMEQYASISIDLALRKLLAGFRLPGEAQKIDRIMEKFAGRYCQDNPSTFKSADDAYVLAFAIIMLNTDAHNPMADQRMTKEDFVSMNCRAAEPGVQVLPPEELEAIFDRITLSEIQTRTLNAGATAETAASVHRRLVSVVGLSHLMTPFRPGVAWNKERGLMLEQRRLIDLTKKAMKNSSQGANAWFSASHTEHARPMLEAGGPSFLKALAAAMESAANAESADRAVESLKMGIKLAALLGCDTLCQQMVATLANAMGVRSREALIRANPHCQVIALQGLISVASDEHAGLLGSSWTTILRTISSVEALVSELRRSPKQVPKTAGSFSLLGDMDKLPSTTFGRLLNQIGLSSKGSIDGSMDSFSGRSDGRSRAPPGGSFRAWVDKEGGTEMDKVFVGSSSLDGDAVLIFTRALCAVSLEELNPEDGSPPRVFSLRKLVECAYYNLDRIRLVWGRLWSAISAHLVNASCHPDQTVAMYAVDSLRQLVGKLLARAELATFTTQSDTLRPFVMVLKHCSSVVVRELTVQCIGQAITSHTTRIGSGWVLVMEVLFVAAKDPAATVVRQCLDTLQVVIDSHWKSWGKRHDVLIECVKVAERCARNPHHLESSLRAVQVLKFCATELLHDGASTEDVLVVVRSSSLQLGADFDPKPSLLSSRSTSVSESAPIVDAEPPPLEIDGDPIADQVWTAIFQALASVITNDERRRCADMAADILFNLVEDTYSHHWELETWKSFVEFSVKGVFDVLQGLYLSPGGVDRVLTYSEKYFPQLWQALGSHYTKVGSLLLPRFLDLLVIWMQHPLQAVAIAGVSLLQLLTDSVSSALDVPGWQVVVGTLKEAWKVCTCTADIESPVPENSNPFKAWLDDPKGLMTLSAIRSRCNVLIAFQQYLDKLHITYANSIPHAIQLELVDILLDSVNQAAKANRDNDFLNALGIFMLPDGDAHVLDPANGSSFAENTLSQTVHGEGDDSHRSEMAINNTEPSAIVPHLADDEESRMEDAVVQPRSSKDIEHTVEDVSTSDGAGKDEQPLDNVESGNDADDQVRDSSSSGSPKIDGDDALNGTSHLDDAVVAAERTSQSGPSTSASVLTSDTRESKVDEVKKEQSISAPQNVIQWPQLMMDVNEKGKSVFHGLVRVEAEGGALAIGALLRCLHTQEEVEDSEMHSCQQRLITFCQQLIKQAADDTQSMWGKAPSPDPYLITIPLQAHWDQAARAPVVAQALDAYRSLDEAVVEAQLKVLFPYLSKLVYCQQPTVRQALASLLYDRLTPLLFNDGVN